MRAIRRKKAHIVPFDEETTFRKGRGFFYKGQEYVHHSSLHHSETAFRGMSGGQKMTMAAVVVAIAAAFILNWHATLVGILAVITALYFGDLLFTCFLIISGLVRGAAVEVSQEDIGSVREEDWPRYTVFCPLYKEWQVVPQFVRAMTAMQYPAEKLQIMFLLEEDDTETLEKVRNESLPPNFHVVAVPHSKPKTKPKAMNYGLSRATGEFLVIYDAEDVPDPLQLKKAVLAFRQATSDTVCVQAKLNFYNPRQNALTRAFTAEYSLWFDLVLPGLQSIHAPIPLGGTSNHFKVSVLRELAGWDAFNVTEDCDLGVRLAKRGYRTVIVDSTTEEEANSDLMNWYRQRSRWIKGYIQTYIVHMRAPKKFVGSNRVMDITSFQLVVGAKILSMFVNPLMWAITLAYFVFRSSYGPFIQSLYPPAILYIGVFCLVLGNFLYLYNYMIGCVKRGYTDIVKYAFIVPLYWLGMSVAAWKALYEVFVKPHYWAKTVHGLHLFPAAETIAAAMSEPAFEASPAGDVAGADT